MDNYFTYTALLGLRDSNITPFKDSRIQHYKSVKKMMDLIEIAKNLAPEVPTRAFQLDMFDPEWDDKMPFPTVNRSKYLSYGVAISTMLYFYSYNYNTFTHNIRYRTFRNLFPLCIAALFFGAYSGYRQQILKINLFDEYCWLRSQELVKQNEYLLKHQDFKKNIWWNEDFKETLDKIYRQGQDHAPSDFKDSELILQDFINRYVDPQAQSPMKQFKLNRI